jgi:hypothetical protein
MTRPIDEIASVVSPRAFMRRVSLALAAVIGYWAHRSQTTVTGEGSKYASSEGVFLMLLGSATWPPLEASVGVHKRGVGGRRQAFLGCYSLHSPMKVVFRWQTRAINTSTALAEPGPV